MPGLPPDYAIQQRIVKENKIEDAKNYDNKMKNLGINTEWYLKNLRSASTSAARQKQLQIRSELNYTYEEIKVRRTIRLKELYTAEYEMYEKELAEKGLAIVKER